MNLYRTTKTYTYYKFKNRDEWLEKRISGIGGSDSSILVGMNPWKSNLQLWREKQGIIQAPQITNEAIAHGNALEPVLRDWFKATHPEYEVQYRENAILQNKAIPWRLYSPDGLLIKDGKKGILEIKTTTIQNKQMIEKWDDGVPDHYFIQTLHGLLTTGFDFVHFVVEVKYSYKDVTEIIEREFTKEEVQESLIWLDSKERKAYQYYLDNVEPPQILTL